MSLLIFGLELHQAWWRHIIVPSSGKPVGAFNVQSIDGFLARALTGGRHLRDWTPIQGLGFEFTALRWLSIAGFTGAAGWVCWRAGAPRSQRGSSSASRRASKQSGSVCGTIQPLKHACRCP